LSRKVIASMKAAKKKIAEARVSQIKSSDTKLKEIDGMYF